MQSGSAHSLGAAVSPKSAGEWLADSSLWWSRQRFRDFLTRMRSGGHFGDRGFSNQLWEKCWECSGWEKKRVNANTQEPELLLKYRAVEVFRRAVKFKLLQCHFQNLLGHESFQTPQVVSHAQRFGAADLALSFEAQADLELSGPI